MTTYANLNEFNQLGIQFVTLRRRSKIDAEELQNNGFRMASDRAEGRLAAVHDPRILDGRSRAEYEGAVASTDRHRFGSRGADVLLTNQMTPIAARLIERYARRMIIENSIEDGIDFFHMCVSGAENQPPRGA